MAYQIRYYLEFISQENNTCLLELYQDYVGDPIETEYLTGTTNPVIQRAVDNDRSLYTPIRGQELVAEFVSSTLSITDFIADDDLTWKGIFKVNGDVVFEGFLLQEDSQEDFVSYLHTIRLKFTDGLALLKGVEFSDSSGLDWFSTPTVYSILKTILLKTGSIFRIHTLANIFPSDVADPTAQSTFELTKLYTKSFMKNQSDFMDCYSVLSEIMKAYGCTIYQYRGEWYIDRWIDRLEQVTQHHLYELGDTSTDLGDSWDVCPIGETELIKEVENPLLLSVGRAAKENKITYNFNTWSELIRNLDLDEGDINFPLSGSGYTTYELDYWTAVSRTGYWRKEFNSLGFEIERYMYIEGAADFTAPGKYIKSESFPALKGDIIIFSYSACSEIDMGRSWGQIEVKCGAFYLRSDGTWSDFSPFQIAIDWLAADDSTEWKSTSVESIEIPADGDLEIRCLVGYNCGSGNKIKYKDMKIEYIPSVSNSRNVKGDYNNYTNPVTTKNPTNETVFLSDSNLKVLNGALLKVSGALETSWQRGANTEEYRFSQLNALGYYQSSYRSKLLFDGTFKGTFYLNVSYFPIGFYPIYTIADVPGKLFTLTSLNEINWNTGIWSGSLIEVHDTTLDVAIDTPPGTFVYNYIFG